MSIFTETRLPAIPTSTFDLSHDVKLSFKMGYLVPTAAIECLPGDSWKISVQNLLRFAPLSTPVMHKIYVTTHYFFVPNRLLWPKWQEWITGNDESSAHPYIRLGVGTNAALLDPGSLGDYLGIPTGPYGTTSADDIRINPFPIAAYYKIFDEYFRDQNLVTERYLELVDGDNSVFYKQRAENPPLQRAWMHDYFTSALPFAQKGDSVQVPLVTQNDIPVDFNNNTGFQPVFRRSDTNAFATGTVTANSQPGDEKIVTSVDATNPVVYDPQGTLSVDVQAGATNIETLRRAFRLQEWLERNARGGTRYTEHMKAHFRVISSDARLQRPEYIGSVRQNMVISEVLNTAGSETGGPDLQPVGTMAGHGISLGGGSGLNCRCEEHGFIIGMINVQPVTAYMQGIHRSFTRFDKLDYAWPTFANLGEQEVKVKELYVEGITAAEQEETFGYVPRYAEYRYLNSRVAGEMRSTLADWHLARIFNNKPVLNESFILANPDTRIFAVEDPAVHNIYAHIFNNITVNRRLPAFAVPTI